MTESPEIQEATATHAPLVPAPSQITLDECLSLNHTIGEYGPCGMPATWWECMADALDRYDTMDGGTSLSVDRARGVLGWDMRACDRLFPDGSPGTGQTEVAGSPADGPAVEPHGAPDDTAWQECDDAAWDAAMERYGGFAVNFANMELDYDLAVCDRMFPP